MWRALVRSGEVVGNVFWLLVLPVRPDVIGLVAIIVALASVPAGESPGWAHANRLREYRGLV